jgi:hypothetical protein
MRRTARFAAVYIALTAMFLRALVPAGWMPADIASGAPITICTMQGALQIAPHGHSNKDGAQHNEICPFAASPSLSTPQTVAALALPSVLTRNTEHAVSHYAVRELARHEPQSPRGPPSLA